MRACSGVECSDEHRPPGKRVAVGARNYLYVDSGPGMQIGLSLSAATGRDDRFVLGGRAGPARLGSNRPTNFLSTRSIIQIVSAEGFRACAGRFLKGPASRAYAASAPELACASLRTMMPITSLNASVELGWVKIDSCS